MVKFLFSLIKKFLLILGLAMLVLILITIDWKTDGTCDVMEKVNFRGIHFQFPMKARGVMKAPMSQFSRHYTWLQTDSIGGKNTCGKWFFEWDSDWDEKNPFTETFKEKLIYGVAFELYEDSCRTNQEIVEEIQKMYPGNYKYFEKFGNGSFIWERDCMTIFVKRIYLYHKGYSIPEVSFCFGLTSSQVSTYATYTSYIDNYPD